MNRTLTLVSALSVGLSAAVFTAPAMAQAAPAAAPAAAAPVKPEALPAKIAVIDFEQAVSMTNEGQAAGQTITAKYAPLQQKVTAEGTEVESLRKQLEAMNNTTPDAARQQLATSIEGKEKQLNLDLETAQNQFGSEVNDALSKIAQKMSPIVTKYLQDNGYTLMLSRAQTQQSASDVLWFDPRVDITLAIVEAYNASSGVAAPLPTAPAGTAPKAPAARTGTTTPRPAPKAAPATK